MSIISGVNLAYENELNRTLFSQRKGAICVFLSHKKEDELAATCIGKYLMDIVGVNIYLDNKDVELKEAVSTGNDKKIVESINQGLACSSHLLCITSEATKMSWWVPYEIGIADKSKLDIATLKLKGVEDVPSFLKIHDVIVNTDQFLKYCSTLDEYGRLFSERNYEILKRKDMPFLKTFIEQGD